MTNHVETLIDAQRAANVEQRLAEVRNATRDLRRSSREQKDLVLKKISEGLDRHRYEILKANRADVAALDANKATKAFVDRLTLNPQRIAQMQDSLRDVIALADPVGEVVEERRLPNDLLLKRVRAPLGVLFMIFESRPNVITEAFSLALKSGNGLILKGGNESAQTAEVIYRIISKALADAGLPAAVFWGMNEYDRTLTHHLIRQNKYIDVVVPRGGEGLIDFITKHATIPIIKNDRGLCHIYVHEDADLEMAAAIIVNAKTQRPGVCNAMETLLVHESLKQRFLPMMYERLAPSQVEWLCCAESLKVLQGRERVQAATEKSFDTEHLDLRLNCRVVASLDEAIAHIERHGSRHSEAIITPNAQSARLFQESVDAAAVYWNASTRFTDGYQFGLGGELGISTQKLHVRGPVGLRELTSSRWIIDGSGQVRS